MASATFGNRFVVVAFCCCILLLSDPTNADTNPAPVTLKTDYVRTHILNPKAPSIGAAAGQQNFLDWYQDGVRSYLANDWTSCVDSMRRAIAGYRDYYAATAECRLRCRKVANAVPPFYADNVDDMHYYESIVRRTLCLVKCKQLLLAGYDEFFEMNAWSQDVFRQRKPYTYLQLCYYRTGDVLNASHATLTALLRNPGDDMMSKNLHFYLDKLSEIDGNKSGDPSARIEDLEQKQFAKHYLLALQAYVAENYTQVVQEMERSLKLLRHELEECRAFCEGDYNQGWMPDFVTSTANHFTYNLRCKFNCTEDMSYIRGKYYENIFASHYEYLHISYYNANQTRKACRAAASYLHIHPESEQMQSNLAFYSTGKLTVCEPRSESKSYAAQLRYDDRLMEFITREFAEAQVKIPTRKLQVIRTNSTLIDAILRQN